VLAGLLGVAAFAWPDQLIARAGAMISVLHGQRGITNCALQAASESHETGGLLRRGACRNTAREDGRCIDGRGELKRLLTVRTPCTLNLAADHAMACIAEYSMQSGVWSAMGEALGWDSDRPATRSVWLTTENRPCKVTVASALSPHHPSLHRLLFRPHGAWSAPACSPQRAPLRP
jgi:hypothetical protein